MEKALINEAIEQLLHQEMYLPLTRDDFEAICPEPELAIHILAGSAEEAAVRLRNELDAASGNLHLTGIIEFVKSVSLTLEDLEKIESFLPRTKRFKRGLSFCSPENNEIELWLFASVLKLF